MQSERRFLVASPAASKPSEWPAVVIREFIDSLESGTEANLIIIRDDLAPLDSASNHIVIHVDEDCGYDETEQPGSVADTEIMPTLEFWENLIDGSFLVPADEGATVDLTSILTLTRLQPARTQKSLKSSGNPPQTAFT
ncbi:uncharacterized protein N7487_004311 [Penicillium crustosum]|uniref:uncharacterized protein n=1 Tax=Penicillium crustosum TaxID=36656 RepID=UPI0023A6C51A|nr:uncharacterized protein N7487_004311 [Penicillium crustosum]KAJ5409952.1 hypothetical protein N7487_004311 [Penicillium crustosum]